MQLRTKKAAERRRLPALILTLALLVTFVAPLAAETENFPESIPLPNGFRPEGITVGYGHTFYVGSIPTGAVYSGDLRTGEGGILVEARAGRAAIGMKVDERSGLLFVAGGPTGSGFVYDAKTGAPVADYLFDDTDPRFINDVVVTRNAAYFTNSREAEIYHVPLGPGGSLAGDFETLPLTGDWVQTPDANSANGIVATPDDKWLIVINSGQQQLFRVDPDTGEATLIDLGGALLPNGDGLWLQGHTLWVVQNRLNQVAVVELNADYTAGDIVDTITNDLFRVPTTIAPFGRWFYAVNARFGTPPTPETDYDIVRFDRR